jgi:hypothetical protein
MTWLSRHVLLTCALVLAAIGVAGMTYAAALASGDFVWWVAKSAAHAAGQQFPALAAICGGLLVMIGIRLIGGSGENGRRRFRYTKSGSSLTRVSK